MMAKLTIYRRLILSSLLVLGMSSQALAVPGDYDGDGTSDLSVALVDRRAGTTAWLTRLTNGSTPKFWTFFTPADAYVSGRFYVGDNRYYPGIVYVRSSSEPLEWTLKTPTGGEVAGKFGLPGDIITNLGDWDGDGREDFHTVRKGADNVLNWYVFLTGYARIIHLTFGVDGDQVGVSDVDGDGMVEMVALRNNFFWYVRKPFTPNFTTVQWGVNGDIPLMPRDITGDGKPEYIISRKEGAAQVAYIRDGNTGVGYKIPLGFASSVPQVGDFGAGQNFAWSQRDTGWTAIRGSNGVPNVFRLGIPTNAVIRPDGTVVQPTSTAVFPAATETTPESGSGESGSSDVANCSSVLGSGYLLKPASQDTRDAREGKPMVLFSRNYPSSGCLNVIATNGNVVAHYGRYAANRYYAGSGCGEKFSASQIAAKAVAASGSKNIYVQDPATGRCYGPGPADGRTDRR